MNSRAAQAIYTLALATVRILQGVSVGSRNSTGSTEVQAVLIVVVTLRVVIQQYGQHIDDGINRHVTGTTEA